jgi:hypothetical protein
MASKKSLKNGINLETRLQFYSLLTRKTADYLENILGKPTFNSLQNCELSQQEIESINQDLIAIVESEREDLKKSSSLLDGLISGKVILLRPELTICSELVLEFLLSQKLSITSINEIRLSIPEFLEIYDYRLSKNHYTNKFLPTSIINFIHSPAKIIYLKEPLNQDGIEFIQKNILHKEYKLMASMYGPRITNILDPIRYIQNSYLGLSSDTDITTEINYLAKLEELISIDVA